MKFFRVCRDCHDRILKNGLPMPIWWVTLAVHFNPIISRKIDIKIFCRVSPHMSTHSISDEKTRVKLEEKEDLGSDYISANFVSVGEFIYVVFM